MGYISEKFHVSELLLYLRKSRADNPDETVEEVLAKHEQILQDYCEREYGHRIPEDNIYREVVSGESIEERDEIKKVLTRCEDAAIKGVVVIEPQRLSRGDLVDCGNLINILQYTGVKVVTPVMTYDLSNKIERKFFQDELMRGRDFLEYVKEILMRGKFAAAKKGCYVQALPPFGYDKEKRGKDIVLRPNRDADTVRLIFELYVNQNMTCGQIARRLTEMGISTQHGKQWHSGTIGQIIRNPHYDGKIVYHLYKTVTVIENGKPRKTRVKQSGDEVLLVEGKHQPLIDHALFERAQIVRRNNPRKREHADLINPLAGILRCGHCGRNLLRHVYTATDDRILCNRQHPPCMKSVKFEDMLHAVIQTLEVSEVPELERKLLNGDGNASVIHLRQLEALEKQLAEYREQEETQYELLETKRYTQELFDRRNAILRQKIAETEKQIAIARRSIPKEVDYRQRIALLKKAIAALKDNKMPCTQQNQIVKEIVEKIDVKVIDKGRGATPEFNMNVTLHL